MTATQEKTDVPDGWTFHFDLADEEHCHGDAWGTFTDEITDKTIVADVTENLPTPYAPAGGTPEPHSWYNLRDAISDTLREYQDALDELEEGTPAWEELNRRMETLDEFSTNHAEHGGCQCGYDIWQACTDDYVTEILGALTGPGEEWLLYRCDEPAKRLWDQATVSRFFEAMRSRDGWQEVTLTWHAETRTMDLRFGDGSGSHWGKAAVLTQEQAQAVDWFDSAGYDDSAEVAHEVLTRHPFVTAYVMAHWEDEGEGTETLADQHGESPVSALRVIGSAVDLVALPAEALAAAHLLLKAGFTGDLEDLLTTARTVAETTTPA